MRKSMRTAKSPKEIDKAFREPNVRKLTSLPTVIPSEVFRREKASFLTRAVDRVLGTAPDCNRARGFCTIDLQ